jgi:hypothetical protein
MFRYLHGSSRRQMLSPLRSRPSKGKPKLPEGVRIYAMTDIHGCAHLLKQMLRVIDADLARSHTPVRHPELLKKRANIDTGAYATGNLTLMAIQGTSMLAI